MKRRTSMKRVVRRPRRRRITAAEKQQITQMMRKAGIYAFTDRLADLKKGVDPKRVREILVSPFTVLGPWRDLEEQLRAAQEELPDTRGGACEACQARIAQIGNELVTAAKTARLAYGQPFGRRKTGPSGQYWHNAPVDMPDEQWLNPQDWPWLCERATRLADYLRTTRLPNPKRPWRIAMARDTVRLFYRMGHFPKVAFSPDDAEEAVKTFYR